MRQMPESTELLLRVSKDRDTSAYEQLFHYFAPRLKAVLAKQGADAGTAEELMQETMLAVWRKAGQFSPDRGAASTWIFTIARNVRIDRLRKQKVVWQEFDETSDVRESDDLPPDEAVAVKQTQRRVREALSGLPPDQSEVIRLSYVEGLSHAEIAERLGTPLGTIKSRLRLAYSKVRETLQDDQ